MHRVKTEIERETFLFTYLVYTKYTCYAYHGIALPTIRALFAFHDGSRDSRGTFKMYIPDMHVR